MKLYADTADPKEMVYFNNSTEFGVDGFTTNPSLMKQAGIKDYEGFAKEMLQEIKVKPISFEVIGDDYREIVRQAEKIASWGENVYVKIPVSNTSGIYNFDLMRMLSKRGIKVNATAITTFAQITDVTRYLNTDTPTIISIFAGRIADTGRNPQAEIIFAHRKKFQNQEILWASTREICNFIQASVAGADIITMTPALIMKKKQVYGKSLDAVSEDVVKQFLHDAIESNLTL
jgi:transaldolase